MLLELVCVFLFCFVLERLIPGWRLPKVRTWPLRTILLNGVQIGVVLLAGISWERWLQSFSMFHLSNALPDWASGLFAYFIATFVFYWWHRWRHEADRHRNNYGDIVWWDMLFGTWENPRSWDGRCGFSPEKEERLGDMLRFRDVHCRAN